jgi:transposase
LLLEKAKESIGLTQGLQMARKELQFLLTQYNVLQAQIEQVMECVKELVEQINGAKAMLTIPGVGLVTVAGFLAEVGDLSSYDHPNQIQKLAGLNLKENSSGKHKGKSQITKRGRPRLRGLLYRCVLTMVAKNPQFKAIHAYNTHRVNNPLKPKQSLVALCVKLIRVLFTLGTKRVPYDPGKLLGPVRQALLTQAA